MSSMTPRRERIQRPARTSLSDFMETERAAIEAVRSWFPGPIVVFGSRSKGNYADDSDLDLGVTGMPNRRHLKSVLADLRERYGYKIELRPADQVKGRKDALTV